MNNIMYNQLLLLYMKIINMEYYMVIHKCSMYSSDHVYIGIFNDYEKAANSKNIYIQVFNEQKDKQNNPVLEENVTIDNINTLRCELDFGNDLSID